MYILERNIARWEKIDAFLYRGIKSLLIAATIMVIATIIFTDMSYWAGI